MYLNKDDVDNSYICDDEEIAENIIETIACVEEPDIVDVAVGVIFRDHEIKKGGAVTWASIERPAKLLHFFANEYFGKFVDVIIQIDYNIWCRMDHIQRKALIHHELKHIRVKWDEKKDDYSRNKYTNRIEFMLIVHDKEEFYKIENMYGSDWAEQLREEEENG